ncbi:MAG: ribonuclease E/G [Crocinitomicaceae bacterium]|nr:ribonuclease E/G [Crocinitomicaceae bacterium]
MQYELVVNSSPAQVVLALLKEKKLIEIHQENDDSSFNVGDVYLGKIRKIVPSLNAAFVDVGYEKDAFLHYHDLGPRFKSMNKYVQNTLVGKQSTSKLGYNKIEAQIDKDGKMKDHLSSKQLMAVQVIKEPISAKGPRISAEVTLAGRFLVLVPFSDKISVSQKIKEQSERDRLRRLITSIKPKHFGVIIRTEAQNQKVAELDQDLKDLEKKWAKLYSELKTAKPHKRVFGEMNRAMTVLRDILNKDFTNITVDDPSLYNQIRDYVKTIAPEMENIVKLYKGKVGIFEDTGINKQIKASFGRKVNLPSGGYLIVEHTEAMHVIDVNSGNRKATAQNQEENALQTNIEAAEEIARILRLRDMGGIIVVDFIDMYARENNKKLTDSFRKFMKGDRAKYNIIPPSKFGVIELTRQRVRPETEIKTAEVCPTCNGNGEVQASILIIDEIENSLKFLVEEMKSKTIILNVHPFIEAFLKKGVKSIQRSWFLKYKKWIQVRGITKLAIVDYNFVDEKNKPYKV